MALWSFLEMRSATINVINETFYVSWEAFTLYLYRMILQVKVWHSVSETWLLSYFSASSPYAPGTVAALWFLTPFFLAGSGVWALGVGQGAKAAQRSQSLCTPTYIPVRQLWLPTPVGVASRDGAHSCQAGLVFHHQVFPVLWWNALRPKKLIQGVSFNSSTLVISQLPALIVM